MKKMLDSLKIKTRLLTLIVFIIVVILILFAANIFSSQRLLKDLEELNDAVLPAIHASQEIRNNLTQQEALLIEASYVEIYVIDMREKEKEMNRWAEKNNDSDIPTFEGNVTLERIKEIQEEITALVEVNNTVYFPEIEKQLTSKESRALFEKIETSLNTYREIRDEAIELALEGKDGGELFNQAIEYSTVVDQNINELLDFADSYGDSLTNSAVKLGNFISVFTCILVVSIIVIVIIISYFIIGSMTKPINIIKSGLFQVASGDLTVEIPTHYKAEFGEMFKSFREMVENLNALILGAKGTSDHVHSTFIDVENGVEKINESITEMDSFLNTLATNMSNQAAGLKESSAAMDNIASGIHQIAESSMSVAELAAETSTQANDGSTVIEKSVAQMEMINRVVEDTSGVVERLIKRAKTIDEALKAITGIAEQTNLLALNASIEAARAGEQGRGFAVVADEVSKLAAQSKESANEINVLLQEINKDTEEAVHAMRQGKMESKQGIEVIHQAGQAFNSIVDQVTIMTEQVQEVSSTVEEMSAGTEEINSSLSEVVRSSEAISAQTMEVVQKNNAQIEVVNEIVDVVSEVNEGANKLGENLNEFKTENENGAVQRVKN